ncbi:hypothetical protein CMO93_05880 [Candidatus Woesearchaeota archaeon]|nr:hypothetical protein [Candidatus Woesearchaeota archaeon]|tara:strand:+ start:286 stop:1461 length:1176 start_codon:yes stop_codon:yes gene_type:complete
MGIENNISRFYLYRIFQSAFLFVPIFILFLLDNGLSMMQALFTQGYFALLMVLFEVPSGTFADKFGRKTAIVASSILVFFGTLTFALGHTFLVFLLAETFFALGVSMWSGTDSAFIYDTLKNLKRTKEFKKVYGNTQFVTFFMFGVGSLIGSYFADINLRLVIWLTLIPFGIAIILSLTLTEPKFSKKVEHQYWGHIKEAFNYAKNHKQIRFFIIFFMFVYGISESMWHLNQPYFKFVGLPIKFFGVIYFFIFLTTALAAKYAYKIEKSVGIKNTLYLIVIAPLLVYVILGLFPSIWWVVLTAVPSFVFGMQYPIIDNYINKNVESHHRATIISLKNLSGMLLYATYAPFVGFIADIWSITTSFLISALILLIDYAILSYIFHIKKSKVFN